MLHPGSAPLTDVAGSNPVWGECKDCLYVWIVLYTPMLLDKAARVMRSVHCPRCGANAKRIKVRPYE